MSDTARLEKQIPAKHFIADNCRLTCVLLICLAKKGITPAPHKTIWTLNEWQTGTSILVTHDWQSIVSSSVARPKMYRLKTGPSFILIFYLLRICRMDVKFKCTSSMGANEYRNIVRRAHKHSSTRRLSDFPLHTMASMTCATPPSTNARTWDSVPLAREPTNFNEFSLKKFFFEICNIITKDNGGVQLNTQWNICLRKKRW